MSMDVDNRSPNCRCLSLSACVHTVQSLLCSHTVTMDVDEVSDQIVDECLYLQGCTLSKASSAPIQ